MYKRQTLTFDPEEWQKIVDFFTRTGRETTPHNRKQMCIRDRSIHSSDRAS